MNHDEMITSFVAITGSLESEALQMLEATNYQLQEAIELFFAAAPEAGFGPQGTHDGGAAPTTLTDLPPSDIEDDEAFARRLQNEANAAQTATQEEVRAPLPTRVERLYGDVRPIAVGPIPGLGRHHGVPTNVVDAFRDFRGEAESTGAGSSRLSSMFEPPRDLIFHGGFEEAKIHAVTLGRWLIVNVQNTAEFASHRLNRDTWRDAGVRALIGSSFVLHQVYDVTEEGQKLQTFYNVYEIPAILVLDPVTGAPVRHWTGFISPERLAEDLMPFLDISFSDPGAARLAASLKRKHAHGTGPSGLVSGRVDDASGSCLLATTKEEEDRELQVPRARSLQETTTTQSIEENLAEDVQRAKKSQGQAKPSAEDVAALAAERLPAEPTPPDGCRIAIRYPEGTRSQRRFPLNAPVQALYDWCLSQSMEAAGGRPFILSEAMPGALSLEDRDASIQEAGLMETMLVLKWVD